MDLKTPWGQIRANREKCEIIAYTTSGGLTFVRKASEPPPSCPVVHTEHFHPNGTSETNS